MLTVLNRSGRLAAMVALATALIASALLTFVSSAAAEGMCKKYDENGNYIGYGNCEDGNGGDPGDEDPPDGGGGEPECEKPAVVTDPYGDFFWCEGEIWCQGTTAVTEPPADAPPKPDPDATWIFYTCWNATAAVEQGFRWSEPNEVQPPTLAERAEEAYGQLTAPAFSLEFNPNTLAFVGDDTTFWANGPTDDTFTGTEALGLVAQTVNGRVVVDPGDGSRALQCGWAVDRASAKANGCVRTYDDASTGGPATGAGGQPAYAAQAHLEFDVQFLLDGAVIDVPDLDAQFLTWETNPEQTAVPVGELQVIVQ